MSTILLIFVLALLLTVSVGAMKRPVWGLTFVVLMYAFEQSLQGAVPIFRAQPALANYWTAVVVAISAFTAILRQERPFVGYFSGAWMLSVLIFAWAAASLLWTPSVTARGMTTDGIPYFILFLILAPLLVDSTEDLRNFVLLMMWFGTLVASSIIANPEFNIESGRLGLQISFKVRSSPLAMGELGGALVILAALYNPPTRVVLVSVLRLAALVFGTILVLYSGSRGQLIFAALTAIAFFPASRRIKNVFSFFFTTFGLVLIAASVILLARLVFRSEGGMVESRWNTELLAQGTQVRRENALDLLAAFARTPTAWIFGLGWNAFSFFTKASTEPYSHAILLDILCELGIPAFVAMLAIIWWAAQASIRLFRSVAESPADRSVVTSFIALAAYQVLLSNKQGMLWAAGPLFLHLLVLIRIDQRNAVLGYTALPGGNADDAETPPSPDANEGFAAPT